MKDYGPDYTPLTKDELIELHGDRANQSWVDHTRCFLDGHGNLVVNVHPENDDCRTFGCAVHNPSDHSMRHMPTLFRGDNGMTERVCEHGVGHPDPDNLGFIERTRGANAATAISTHGCDGCCAGAYDFLHWWKDNDDE